MAANPKANREGGRLPLWTRRLGVVASVAAGLAVGLMVLLAFTVLGGTRTAAGPGAASTTAGTRSAAGSAGTSASRPVIGPTPGPAATSNSLSAPGMPLTQQTATEAMIMYNAYWPTAMTAQVGEKVSWVNHDATPHTVTISSGPDRFTSPGIPQGRTFIHAFAKPGTYTYVCLGHPKMTGTLTVTARTATPSGTG